MPMKLFLLRLPVEVHRCLKIRAAEHEVSMKAFLIRKILEDEKNVDRTSESTPAGSTPLAV
jgi:plasmid stability protein